MLIWACTPSCAIRWAECWQKAACFVSWKACFVKIFRRRGDEQLSLFRSRSVCEQWTASFLEWSDSSNSLFEFESPHPLSSCASRLRRVTAWLYSIIYTPCGTHRWWFVSYQISLSVSATQQLGKAFKGKELIPLWKLCREKRCRASCQNKLPSNWIRSWISLPSSCFPFE